MSNFLIESPALAIAIKDFSKLDYSKNLLASNKLDGIRCLINGEGKAVSRNFKPIPNVYVREIIEGASLVGFDGEIIIEDSCGNPIIFNEISSIVMSRDKTIPKEYTLKYYVFDYVKDSINKPYNARLTDLSNVAIDKDVITRLIPDPVNSFEELQKRYEIALAKGFEGLILRSSSSPYKCGRSTFNEHYLLKMKPFDDSEAVIIDLVEGQENQNEAKKDVFGHTDRSSHKVNKVNKNTLGAFIVRDLTTNLEFSIGTGIGLTKDLKQEIWNKKESYIGRIVKYRFQAVGAKDLPRFPSFLGFRNKNDMS